MISNAGEAPAQGHYARANGLSVYYQEHGAGHPLVLLLQGFDTSQVWRFALPVWAPHFRVIAPDPRGLGRTDHPGGAISYELLARDALAFIRTLGLQQPLICGFADGACVALQMAIWEPEIADDFKSYHLDLKFPSGDTDENAAARLQIRRIWDINPWDRNMYGLGRLSVDAHNPTVRADADLEGRGDLDAG